tara:strand:- start:260 stop:487 length:228 start_codon:yes stop_codon:yes gene_type:complete
MTISTKNNHWWWNSDSSYIRRDDVEPMSDFRGFYCNICTNVWEVAYVHGKRKLFKYDEFPSYKLKRKDCIECEAR